mgnify:CR=1 FL=1
MTYMRKIILFLALLAAIHTTGNSQQKNETICRLGFDYDISQSRNWGYNQLVVTKVYPYSSAELAGLKKFDIIDTINGIDVRTISDGEIEQLLNPAGQSEVVMTVKNLAHDSRQILIKKDCKKSLSISEDQLASAFSMYSLETTKEVDFTCPFKTTVTKDTVSFSQFKTFAFSPIDENNRELEEKINENIKNELTKKGMTVDVVQPDILIQTYYYFDKNPNYVGTNKIVVKKEAVYRYNLAHNKVEKFPFLASNTSESEAEYLLQFGIRLIDQKIQPGRVLWECESNELMETAYSLNDYAQAHTPLMFMQYPYVKYSLNVPYHISMKSYNYTGISYDINRLELISEVKRNSPAYEVGIRAKDVVEKIGRNKMGYTSEEFSKAYKQFITKTLSYRDPKTIFTDSNGFKYCMLWDVFKYPQVADAINEPDNLGAFSYLYFFTPYINPTGNNACTFVIRRGKEKKEVVIRPTIHTETTIEVK